MQYYSQYGHRDFVLCLGYKANIIKDFFLNWRQQTYSDCVISEHGKKVEMLGEQPPDWRVTLVDTGIWRNIGQRLLAVREHVKNEEMFLANYSDGLTDAPLPEMVDLLKRSGKVGCFLAVRPPLTFHLVEFDKDGNVAAPARQRTTPRSGSTAATSSSRNRDLRLHARKARSWWSSRSSG